MPKKAVEDIWTIAELRRRMMHAVDIEEWVRALERLTVIIGARLNKKPSLARCIRLCEELPHNSEAQRLVIRRIIHRIRADIGARGSRAKAMRYCRRLRHSHRFEHLAYRYVDEMFSPKEE